MALTIKRVAKLLRRGAEGRHFDGLGLYLVIANKKNASWARRYELHHKAHEIGLGSARVFTLAEARERNREISKQLTDGIDPLVQKRAERATQAATAATTKTFKECAEAYIADHQAKWRSARHGAQWLTTLAQYVYPKIGNIDVAAVSRPHVLEVLEQHVPAANGKPAGKFWAARGVTANRVRSRIELVLSWATGRGYRDGDNPADWDVLKSILPVPAKTAPVVHHAAVPYREVPSLVAELRRREGVAAMALRFLILTATRAGEVLGATWEEIDLGNKVWTIPENRIKGGREHRVPLSPAAIELLKGLYREAGNPHLFIGARRETLSHTAMVKIMDRMQRTETVHGFRSSFSDWAHEQTAHSNHTIEMSLAHSVGSAVEKAYRRTDLFAKRRQLMEQWSKFVMAGAPAKVHTGNVTAIRGAR